MNNNVPFPQRKLSFLLIAMLMMLQSVWRPYRKQTECQLSEKRAGAAILRHSEFTQQPLPTLLVTCMANMST